MSVAVSGAAKLVVAIMAGNDVVVGYNALIDRWNALAAELRVVHRHLRAGRVSRGLQVLVELLDSLDGLSDGEELLGKEGIAPSASVEASDKGAARRLAEDARQHCVGGGG